MNMTCFAAQSVGFLHNRPLLNQTQAACSRGDLGLDLQQDRSRLSGASLRGPAMQRIVAG